VIGMAREHVREAVVLEPSVQSRTFTLKELARLAAASPRRPGEEMSAWIGRLGAGQQHRELVGVGHDDAFDVADPMGGPLDGYQRAAAEIDDLLRQIVQAGWPAEARSA